MIGHTTRNRVAARLLGLAAVLCVPAPVHERVNAAAGAALETLARVPDLLALGGT